MSETSSHAAAGRWDIVSKTPFGEQGVQVDLNVDGGSLSGIMINGAETAPLEDTSLEGNSVAFAASLKTPMEVRIVVNVTIDGDTMTGTAKAGVLPEVPTEGRRIAA